MANLASGQVVAASAAVIDALFGLLYVLGVVHAAPDQTTVLGIVAIAFNASAYVLAFIQHQQHTNPAPAPTPVPPAAK